MSAERRPPESTAAAANGSADLPPAASLLSVPIFRAAAREQAARRQAPATRPIGGAGASAASSVTPAPDSAAPAAQPEPQGPPAPHSAPYAVVGGTDGRGATASEVAEARPTTPVLKAVDGAQSYRSLLDYWRTLARQGRAPVDKLDGELIAARWPYAMLIRVPRGGVVDITRVFAPEPAGDPASGAGAQGAQHPFARDQASQISSWVLEIAQEAAGSRQPSRHTEAFQQAGRARRITAELLPCHADGDSADHLLLQLRDG